MPTFVFFHKGKKLQSVSHGDSNNDYNYTPYHQQVLGADPIALESGIVKHLANLPTDSSTGSGEQSSVSIDGQVRVQTFNCSLLL